MSIAETLMKRLAKRPAKDASPEKPVKAAEDTQSPTKRLEALTAWLANRDEPAPSGANAEDAISDPVEASVHQFLKQQEARKGKRRPRNASGSTG